MSTGTLNLLLGRLPTYTRKARHLRVLRQYGRPAKLVNLARAELARMRRDVVVQARPYVYTVDTGNYCNLRCPLCPTGYHGLERPQAFMSLRDFESVLEKIRPWALEVVLHNWGEPFLNPDILDMVRAASAAGVGTSISSNLNLVHRSDDFLHAVVESGLDNLTVSLDGTSQEVYAEYRRNGNIEHVLHNMRELLDYRKRSRRSTPVVEWQFLVMKHNEHQLDEARRMAREIGVDELRFTSAGLPFDELANVELSAHWAPRDSRYRVYDSETIARRGYLHDEVCFYLYRAMTVNPKGEVSPCCAIYHDKWDFGNLLASGLDEIWNNAHYRSSRALFAGRRVDAAVETVCARCPLFRLESSRARSPVAEAATGTPAVRTA